MKRSGLKKLKGVSLQDRMRQAATPGRFGKDAATVLGRREQRKLDKGKGLVPFAVKLDVELVKRLRALAQERQMDLNELVAELLSAGLEKR